MDKHSSLLQKFVNYGQKQKKFHGFVTREETIVSAMLRFTEKKIKSDEWPALSVCEYAQVCGVRYKDQ
jgi:hypothetical protein